MSQVKTMTPDDAVLLYLEKLRKSGPSEELLAAIDRLEAEHRAGGRRPDALDDLPQDEEMHRP